MYQKYLTIVIPSYNSEWCIEKCVNSILNIKNKEKIEIIIVNDGSTDNTGKIANDLKKNKKDIIKVIHKENGGHGSAINAGIKEATGKYFKVLDSDDWIDSKNLEKFIYVLQKVDSDIIASPFCCVFPKKQKVISKQIQGIEKIQPMKLYDFKKICNSIHIRMHEMTIKTDILKKNNIRLNENLFYVDMEFITYPIPYINTLFYFPYSLYQYRLGEEGQSVNINNMIKNRNQHLKVLLNLNKFYQQKKEINNDNVNSYIRNNICNMEANQIQIYLNLRTSLSNWKKIYKLEKYIQTYAVDVYEQMDRKSIWWLRTNKKVIYILASLLCKLKNYILVK